MSLEHQEGYGPKCQLLSEFLSPTFYKIHSSKVETENPYDVMLQTLDYNLCAKVAPLADYLTYRSSNVFYTNEVEAALILASAEKGCGDKLGEGGRAVGKRKRRFDCYMEEICGLLQGGEEGN
eukprot:12839937-Ditylum_brightwellii.AAC.1